MESTVVNGRADIAVVTIVGRLDAVESGSLRQLLQSHLDLGKNRLVVDLSAAEFVDSAGLAALVQGMKQARSNDGDLRLVAPQTADAMRVFELTRFDQVFEIRPTLEQTLADW